MPGYPDFRMAAFLGSWRTPPHFCDLWAQAMEAALIDIHDIVPRPAGHAIDREGRYREALDLAVRRVRSAPRPTSVDDRSHTFTIRVSTAVTTALKVGWLLLG